MENIGEAKNEIAIVDKETVENLTLDAPQK